MGNFDFHVGDRVRALYSVGFGDAHFGEIGTIVEVNHVDVGIVFDNDIRGHNLNGKCADGHGWWISTDNLEPYIDELPEFEPAKTSDLMSLLGG